MAGLVDAEFVGHCKNILNLAALIQIRVNLLRKPG